MASKTIGILESKQYDRVILAAKRLSEIGKTDPPDLKTTECAYFYLATAYMKTEHADEAEEVLNKYGAGCIIGLGRWYGTS